MVDVMGQTPEEFEEMLNAQIAEGERKAAALDEFLATLESARVTGFDSRREVEVEVNQEGTMTRVSIDDDALEGSASDLEEAIMEAYSDAGKNMSRFLREQGDPPLRGGGGGGGGAPRQFGGGDSAMVEVVDRISSHLEQLGR
jgi:putative cytoplasmic protein